MDIGADTLAYPRTQPAANTAARAHTQTRPPTYPHTDNTYTHVTHTHTHTHTPTQTQAHGPNAGNTTGSLQEQPLCAEHTAVGEREFWSSLLRLRYLGLNVLVASLNYAARVSAKLCLQGYASFNSLPLYLSVSLSLCISLSCKSSPCAPSTRL